jgi:hypothetical protein
VGGFFSAAVRWLFGRLGATEAVAGGGVCATVSTSERVAATVSTSERVAATVTVEAC